MGQGEIHVPAKAALSGPRRDPGPGPQTETSALNSHRPTLNEMYFFELKL